MEVRETTRGWALVDDGGRVISLHEDRAEAEAAQAQMEYEGGTNPVMPSPPTAVDAALMRARAPRQKTAIDELQGPEPVTITGNYQQPPRWAIHKHGGTHVVTQDGEEMGRFQNEDAAIENVNLRKYAYGRGFDLQSDVPADAAPLPPMAKGQTGEAEEELAATRHLSDPYYGTTRETRVVGPYRPAPPDEPE